MPTDPFGEHSAVQLPRRRRGRTRAASASTPAPRQPVEARADIPDETMQNFADGGDVGQAVAAELAARVKRPRRPVRQIAPQSSAPVEPQQPAPSARQASQQAQQERQQGAIDRFDATAPEAVDLTGLRRRGTRRPSAGTPRPVPENQPLRIEGAGEDVPYVPALPEGIESTTNASVIEEILQDFAAARARYFTTLAKKPPLNAFDHLKLRPLKKEYESTREHLVNALVKHYYPEPGKKNGAEYEAWTTWHNALTRQFFKLEAERIEHIHDVPLSAPVALPPVAPPVAPTPAARVTPPPPVPAPRAQMRAETREALIASAFEPIRIPTDGLSIEQQELLRSDAEIAEGLDRLNEERAAYFGAYQAHLARQKGVSLRELFTGLLARDPLKIGGEVKASYEAYIAKRRLLYLKLKEKLAPADDAGEEAATEWETWVADLTREFGANEKLRENDVRMSAIESAKKREIGTTIRSWIDGGMKAFIKEKRTRDVVALVGLAGVTILLPALATVATGAGGIAAALGGLRRIPVILLGAAAGGVFGNGAALFIDKWLTNAAKALAKEQEYIEPDANDGEFGLEGSYERAGVVLAEQESVAIGRRRVMIALGMLIGEVGTAAISQAIDASILDSNVPSTDIDHSPISPSEAPSSVQDTTSGEPVEAVPAAPPSTPESAVPAPVPVETPSEAPAAAPYQAPAEAAPAPQADTSFAEAEAARALTEEMRLQDVQTALLNRFESWKLEHPDAEIPEDLQTFDADLTRQEIVDRLESFLDAN